jgi:pyruvate/2-oxoglutarate dehydrogenase complex dihydrolipoamide dehydrogenase (E3) component
LLDSRSICVDGQVIRARRIVIATGSAPAAPPIPGLDQVPFFTNETIFDNDTLPRHLIILGGGPVAVEVAQAYRRLGSAVTILERREALPQDDPELARMLLRHLSAEGISIREGADVQAASCDGAGVSLTVNEGGRASRVSGSHLLVATGRRPRTAGLGLDAAGVAYDDRGITVDRHLRTTAWGIYAAGDVVDGPRFTHVCSHHAAIVIRNAVFRMRAAVDHRPLPWVTYTDPELAQVGMTEQRARQSHGRDVRALRVPYGENDRAHAERRVDGLLKVIADRRGRVLGASVLGPHAGELTHLWVLAIEQKLRLRDLALTFAPYPTWGELNKVAAFEATKPLLTHRLTRVAARVLSRLP